MKGPRKRSIQQERRIAKELGGRTQPNSGAVMGSRGDVLTDKFFIEAKTTRARQFILRLDTLEKMEQQSFGSRRTPILFLTFEMARRDFIILSKEEFEGLTRRTSDPKERRRRGTRRK